MKKTNLFFFSFAIIMAMMFVGCNTDCCEPKSNSTTTTILKQFSITYNDELHADNSANPKTFSVKDKVVLQNLKKSSYTFVGWYDASTDGNKVTGWNAGEKTGDVTLWARWTEWTYTIQYDANGGIGSVDSQIVKYTETVNLTQNTFTKSGHTFVRWATNQYGSGKSYKDKATIKSIAGNGEIIILYAIWKDDKNYISNADQSNDIVLNDNRLLKTSMITVLDTTTDIVCNQSKGVFVTGRGTVTIPPYAIGKYPVTQGLFKAVMGTNPSYWISSTQAFDSKDGLTETDTLLRPVETVNWYQAIVFCNKLSLLLGKTPCYSISGITDWANLAYDSIPTSDNATWNDASCDFNANGYRLPTEVEWECAARGGQYSTTTSWIYPYAGSETIGDVAWYTSNSKTHTWEVGLKQSNTLGLFDMSGNVYEWCWDWHKTDITKEDYTGPSTGANRVDRGGSWYDNEGICDLSYRYGNNPDYSNRDLGFRLACSIAE